MPSDDDIAVARFLVQRRLLPAPIVKNALAQAERVTKAGLDKSLLSVLVEQRRLTQKQAAQIRSLLAAGKLSSGSRRRSAEPAASDDADGELIEPAQPRRGGRGAGDDALEDAFVDDGELLEETTEASPSDGARVSLADLVEREGELIEEASEDGELLEPGVSLQEALEEDSPQDDESGELIEPAASLQEALQHEAGADESEEDGELISLADAPVSVQEALEELAQDIEAEEALAAPAEDGDLLHGVHVCSRCGRVVEERELEDGVAAHVEGRLFCAKCLSLELEGGDIAAGYRIGERLFNTPLGSVYKCKHLASGREGAVEVIPEDALVGGVPLNRLVQIGAAAAEFEHENLLKLHQIIQWQKQVYIEREWTGHFPLPIFIRHRRQKNKGPFPVRFVVQALYGLVQALCYAFDKGVVDGGITPWKTHLHREGGAKLADLGVPPLGSGEDDHPYRAPELKGEGEQIDWRADLYAVGMIAYHMLTLEPPPSERVGPLEPPEHTPTYVDDIILKMTAFSARDRYLTPRAALKDIEQAKARLATTADKVKEINAEIDRMQQVLASSHQKTEALQQRLAALQKQRDAAEQRIKRSAEPPGEASKFARREWKRRVKEARQRIAELNKEFKAKTKEIERALQAETRRQQQLQMDIGKRIEERQTIEQQGWQT